MPAEEYGVRALGVRTLATAKLKPNPHNPRMLFDLEDLHVLEESIARVGILVPLTVYKESRTGDYVILDGQRRWMCAQKCGIEKIAVNEVREPSLIQNIVTMFQIHKLRLDWELMPTALKIELLMKEVDDRNDKRVASLTGLDESVVVRCKKLLSYSKHYRDMMLDSDPDKRVKADFFIELYVVRNDRVVNTFDWFRKDRFTDAMLERFAARKLRSVTEFRVVKQHISNAVKADKTTIISQLLKEFAANEDLPTEHLNIESAQIDAEARKISKAIDELAARVEAIDVSDYYGENEMWDKMEHLGHLIRDKLKAVDRREAPVRKARRGDK